MPTGSRPIGVFDSGIGGLTILGAIRDLLPAEDLLYFGDTAHIPYGERPNEQLLAFSSAITHFLLEHRAKLVVIACNTASAAALKSLRVLIPDVPFVGMEPAVKPAAEQTRTGRVGVIATTGTVQGALFASVVERFAQGVEVIRQACPGLVRQIEAGEFDTPATEKMLRGWLEPMVARGIDALVLGCTHYPIISPLIQRVVGPGVRLIDPAPAIARRVQQVLSDRNELAGPGAQGRTIFITSDDPAHFQRMLQRLDYPSSVKVQAACWEGDDRVSLCTS